MTGATGPSETSDSANGNGPSVKAGGPGPAGLRNSSIGPDGITRAVPGSKRRRGARPRGRWRSAWPEGRPLRVKLGLDPTAPDLHLGHTVVLQKLREFQDLGHTVVLIVGDYTARVGDPSGRSATRPVLSPRGDRRARADLPRPGDQGAAPTTSGWRSAATRSGWTCRWRSCSGSSGTVTVAQLLERDDFAKRMAAAEPISLLELLYPVLQGYDSVADPRRRRARRHRPDLQPVHGPRAADRRTGSRRRSC